jgi:hypothetical protein
VTVRDDPTGRRDEPDPSYEADPHDDPDFISEDGAVGRVAVPDMAFPSRWGSPIPVFVPKTSTPLEEPGDESVIPPFALWAMKYQRHGHLFSRAEVEIRERRGSGDHAVYVIDDGRKQCMVGRLVGTSSDGCTYCLVAHITIAAYEELVNDEAVADDIFAGSKEPALVVVYEAEDAVSNVALVRTFAGIEEVPVEYLPPGPAIVFTENPDGGGEEAH